MTTFSISVLAYPGDVDGLAAALGLNVDELQKINAVRFADLDPEQIAMIAVPLPDRDSPQEAEPVDPERIRQEGATAERERILGILGLEVPNVGTDAHVGLARDPAVTVEDARKRLQELARLGQHDRNARALERIKADEDDLNAPGPGAHAGAHTNSSPDPEERVDRALHHAGLGPAKGRSNGNG